MQLEIQYRGAISRIIIFVLDLGFVILMGNENIMKLARGKNALGGFAAVAVGL